MPIRTLKRENGLYWIEFDSGEKTVARWDGDGWWDIIGSDRGFTESECPLKVIGKAVPPE